MSGTCPNLSFTVDGKDIRTSLLTVYVGLNCRDIKKNTKVSVDAVLQVGGWSLASIVRNGDAGSQSAEGAAP